MMRSTLLALPAVAAFALSGCSQSAGTDASTDASASSPAESATVADASASGAAADSFVPCPFNEGHNRNWKARIESDPNTKAAQLVVTGEIEVPQDGYGGRLTATTLLKMNPPIQVLDLAYVEQPGGKKGWLSPAEFVKTAPPPPKRKSCSCNRASYASADD